jgi:hypothetical protein
VVYADDVNLLVDNIDAIKKNTEHLIDVRREVGLDAVGRENQVCVAVSSPEYDSVQNLLSSHLLSKNVNIRIYSTIILSVVLYEYETCCLVTRARFSPEPFVFSSTV